MVGGTTFRRKLIQREIFPELWSSTSLWQSKRCSRTAQDNYVLTKSSLLSRASRRQPVTEFFIINLDSAAVCYTVDGLAISFSRTGASRANQ
jgi:hypothetical protein